MSEYLVAASVLITQALAAAHTALYGIIATGNLSAGELEGFEQGSQLREPAGTSFGSDGRRKEKRAAAATNSGARQARKKRKRKRQSNPAGASGAIAVSGAAPLGMSPAATTDSRPHCQSTSTQQEVLSNERMAAAEEPEKRPLEASREKITKRKKAKPQQPVPPQQQQQGTASGPGVLAAATAQAASSREEAAADNIPLWQPNPLEGLSLERTSSARQGATAAAPAPTSGLPSQGRRLWSAEEVEHLIQLVENGDYRQRHLGLSRADFRAIGTHFGRTDQAVRSKYYYYLKVEKGMLPEQRRREPAARRGISYGWMAVHGLGQLPGLEGTGEQILKVIEAHPPFQLLLDLSIRADSAGVVRWKQRVREELSHRHCFIKTGRKEGGEMVWRLNLADPQQLASRRPPRDLLPFLGRHGKCNG